MNEDELARRRLQRDEHPAVTPPPTGPGVSPSPGDRRPLDIDDVPVLVLARLEALQSLAHEVADELERRGVDDLAVRLRGALP